VIDLAINLVMVQARYRSEPIPPEVRRAILSAAGSGQSIRVIARSNGVSHPTVLRVFRRHGIDRDALRARNALVEEHVWLADRIARSVARDVPPQMRTELPGVATIALTECAGSYDPARGVAFALYAQQRIRGACLDSIRRRHYIAGTSAEHPREASERRADDAESAETVMVSESTKARVMEAITTLPGRYALLIFLHYIEGLQLEQIAPKMGVGASRLSQLHKEALRMLRERMGGR
jgi:RNA polymerase sigma factor (sigma-70 family)